jgi:lysophospholipase L1-like esterase
VLAGDSTVNDQLGWGPGFRTEGLWDSAVALKSDYTLIQFGHNDVPGKGPDRESDAATTYRANLARYVDEARAAGAQPVLVTSIVRRNFTPDGRIVRDSPVPYVEAVRNLAAEKKVPLIDLYDLTLKRAESLGPAGAAELDALDKDGKSDHTHLGPKGRQEIGAIAAREFVSLEPALRPYCTGGSK